MRGPGRWGDTHTQKGCRGPSLGPGVPPRLFIGLTPAPLEGCLLLLCPTVHPHFPCSFCAHSRNSGRGLTVTPLPRERLDPVPIPGTLSWALQFHLYPFPLLPPPPLHAVLVFPSVRAPCLFQGAKRDWLPLGQSDSLLKFE